MWWFFVVVVCVCVCVCLFLCVSVSLCVCVFFLFGWFVLLLLLWLVGFVLFSGNHYECCQKGLLPGNTNPSSDMPFLVIFSVNHSAS